MLIKVSSKVFCRLSGLNVVATAWGEVATLLRLLSKTSLPNVQTQMLGFARFTRPIIGLGRQSGYYRLSVG
jgi:hypothetical protein